MEHLQAYVPGGLDPVHLGDLFDQERYKVIHKLGNDLSSTIWLVRDHYLHIYSAPRIIRANLSLNDCRELDVCQLLASRRTKHLGVKYVASQVLRQFWLDGPNGDHLALVIPAHGPSISQMSRWQTRIRESEVRTVAMQASQGLAYLHSEGICHGAKTICNS